MSLRCEDAGEWGLSAGKLAELRAELDDHLHGLASDEGKRAAEDTRERLADPKVRRRLAAPHLADQVYATLNRWPTRREWLELAALLGWFALILLSDYLSLASATVEDSYDGQGFLQALDPYSTRLITAAWILQCVSRAGFFASFAYSLWRAWKVGWGVWLARVLQLKLIHTVLVVSAFLLLGEALWRSYFSTPMWRVDWPHLLNAPVILGVITCAGLLVWMATRGRAWALGLGLLLAGIFLYPGGPSFLDEYHFTRPILSERTELPDGTVVIRPSTDKVAIEERFRRMDMVAWRGLDLEHNQMTFKMHEHLRFPWHIGGWDLWGSKEDRTTVPVPKKIIYGNKRERIKVHLLGPLTVPGGGLGWLAVPIPFLGLIGLVGMVLVMGRRGPLVMLAYTAICVVAICSTLMPFIFAQQVSELIEISPLGLMGTPFPGIENLLTGPVMSDSWLLIFGLVLSAGVPWLLTGMFLRPAKGAGPQRDAGVALE